MSELRMGEWACLCRENRIHSKSCLKCLRCGADKPDPVTLGRACFALGVFLRSVSLGMSQEEAMREALEADVNQVGHR